MKMWSNEWMFLYALAIVIGNIAVIAYAGYANRRKNQRNRADNLEDQQELTTDSSHRAN
ncbi:MAG: hypothetical protein OXG49_16010 [Chloroflexi bacterium]|nr:hypothetical protein [Chloroflexota bacterium]